MRCAAAICALLLVTAPAAARSGRDLPVMSMPSVKASTGDLDAMLKRRGVRILVVPSRTYFFLDKGLPRGMTAEAGLMLEKWLNKRYQKGPYDITVGLVPTTRERIFQDLNAGKGDIAVANLTVTPARRAIADFGTPWVRDAKEILVTGPSAPAVKTLSDLGGRDVTVRKSSSYHEHLVKLNERLKADGLKPVRIVAADERLEDEDLLEMVDAGMLPWTFVDAHKVKPWLPVLKRLSVREDITLNEGGEIAWFIRKNNPKLKRELNEFIAAHGKTATSLIAHYLHDGEVIRNARAPEEEKKFHALVGHFKKYGTQYGIDPSMLAAQGYQESAFNQKLRMKSGAVGVMQLLPKTARDAVGINDVVTRAEDNIHAGAKYLRHLIKKYLDDPAIDDREKVLMVLAAYNAGPGNLKRFRAKAKKDGFDPNVWFGNVEYGAAAVGAKEAVQYIGNIYKYYFVYSTLLTTQEKDAAGPGADDKRR